jgi:hypothetical protein
LIVPDGAAEAAPFQSKGKFGRFKQRQFVGFTKGKFLVSSKGNSKFF